MNGLALLTVAACVIGLFISFLVLAWSSRDTHEDE